MEFAGWRDGSLLEAASWRLASELSRRHPTTTRLIRAHPGGGQSDCLWLLPAAGNKGDIRLNRNGTIQVMSRFDGRDPSWPPSEWDAYFRADPKEFLRALESAAGLPAPATTPASTPRTLTLRVLAAIAATAVKTVKPIEITPGMVDTSGYGGGPNEEAFAAFPAITREVATHGSDKPSSRLEHRFWFVLRDGEHILAFDQDDATSWTRHDDKGRPVMALYEESRRHLLVTALELLRRVDHV